MLWPQPLMASPPDYAIPGDYQVSNARSVCTSECLYQSRKGGGTRSGLAVKQLDIGDGVSHDKTRALPFPVLIRLYEFVVSGFFSGFLDDFKKLFGTFGNDMRLPVAQRLHINQVCTNAQSTGARFD